MNKELIIEKMSVNVIADPQPSNNHYLLEINEKLQKKILPKLEEKLSVVMDEEIDVELEQLDLNWKTNKIENWTADFIEVLAEKISNEIAKKQVQVTAKKKENQLVQLTLRFLQTGFLVQSVPGIISIEDLTRRVNEELDHEFALILATFLLENEQGLNRFSRHFSVESHTKLFEQHFTAEWVDFLSQMTTLHSINEKNDHNWLRFALKTLKNQENDILPKLAEEKALLTSDLFDFLEKNQIAHNLIQQSDTITQRIENWLKNQTAEIQHFIRFLQSVPFLKTPLNRLISQQIKGYSETYDSLKSWQDQFVKGIHDSTDISQLIREMEGNQWNSSLKEDRTRLKEWVTQLKKRESELSKHSDEKNVVNREVPVLEEESIITPNAGGVLLHAFLPQLFKALDLLNEDHEWDTKTAQINALFAIHYLTSGQTEDITEEQLVLPKLLAGMAVDEELWINAGTKGFSPFSTPEGADFLNRLKTEMEGLIEAIRNNWRPMRNCTWPGLRDDFLNRPGALEQKNEQLILTVEPHTFDILLPHKNWGHSMVKFSWMEQVLYVEWGK